MNSTLRLATRLRSMEDEALVSALRRRGVGGSGIRDLLDLAETLLDAAAIQACLARLDRPTLAALWSGELPGDRFLLTDETGATLPEVREQLSRWPGSGLPDPERFAEPFPASEATSPGRTGPELTGPEPVDTEPVDTEPVDPPTGPRPTDPDRTDRHAAEHAFAATMATTQLLFELDREPARLIARGSPGLPELKRLAEALAVPERDLPTLLDVAERAGLLDRRAGRLIPAEGHHSWLEQEVPGRWALLAGAWAEGLPAAVRDEFAGSPSDHGREEPGSGEHGDGEHRNDEHGSDSDEHGDGELRRRLAWLYPGGRDWLEERVEEGLAAAELLGVTAGEELSSAGAAILAGDQERAARFLASRLPAPVDRVYLQHDLSIVAPGPLAPDLDLRMRSMAEAENQALASTYRVSPASVERALGRGETAETILGFLASVSLGPLPQPLRYLVEEAEARYGRLRVVDAGRVHRGAEADAGAAPASTAASVEHGSKSAASVTPDSATRIRSDDAALLHTVLVDSALAPLALAPSVAGELVSPRDPGVVYWALAEARYPVILEDSGGAAVPPRRRPAVREGRKETSDPLAELVGRLRLANQGGAADLETAWLARRLAAAIRSKSVVTVSVRMPNGSIVDHRLEPASVVGGRLRARDPLSELERTLPLASITAIAPE